MRRIFLIAVAVLVVCAPMMAQVNYKTKLTSGPFLVAPNAASVDWMVVNDGTEAAEVRVTVYKLDLLGPKVAVAPGALTFSLTPGQTMHNANSVGDVFYIGLVYEVVVESTSDKVLPNVNQWSDHSAAYFIPGTLIPAGQFVDLASTKPCKVK